MVARLIAEGKTPSQVVADFAAKGIMVSERSLREQARRKGAYREMGRTMILLPEHIDEIFEEPQCRSSSMKEAGSSGSVDELLMQTDMSERALAHLTARSRKPQSGKSRQSPASVVSLDRMRQGRKTK